MYLTIATQSSKIILIKIAATHEVFTTCMEKSLGFKSFFSLPKGFKYKSKIFQIVKNDQ